MSEENDGTRLLRLQIGDELRAVIDTLLTRDASGDSLADALRLLAAARAALEGPALAAFNAAPDYWTKDSDVGRPDRWDAYMDTTMFGGRVNPLGMPMPLECGTDDEGRPWAEGVVRLGRAYLGGPNMVHGGYVAGLVDHLFGAAMHAGPVVAVTASLTVRYLSPTPVDRDLRLRAWFEEQNGRRLHGRATCHAGDVCTAEAEALFLRVDMEAVADQMGAR